MLPESDWEIKGGAAMKGDRQFEREYREWKEKETPDLWGRIECQLKEHPEQKKAKARPGLRRVYGFGLAVAAAAVFVAVLPGLPGRLWSAAGVGFSISVSATGAVSASCGTDFFFLSRVFIFFRKKGLFKRINHNTKYLSVSIYFPSFIIYAVLTLKVLYVIIFFGGLSVIRPE